MCGVAVDGWLGWSSKGRTLCATAQTVRKRWSAEATNVPAAKRQRSESA